MHLPSDTDLREMPAETDWSWLARLLQVSDSAYPTGNFAHSGGLEGMVQLDRVRNAGELDRFIGQYVFHGLEKVDLPLVRCAREAALAGDGDRLEVLDNLSAALRTPEEICMAASRTGRQRLELLASVMHLDEREPELWSRLSPRMTRTQAPVVAGFEAALAGLPLEPALHAWAFTVVSASLSAALKILRLGQTTIQDLLHQHSGRIPDLVARAMEVEEEQIGSFTPLLDIAAARHKRAFSRLFVS